MKKIILMVGVMIMAANISADGYVGPAYLNGQRVYIYAPQVSSVVKKKIKKTNKLVRLKAKKKKASDRYKKNLTKKRMRASTRYSKVSYPTSYSSYPVSYPIIYGSYPDSYPTSYSSYPTIIHEQPITTYFQPEEKREYVDVKKQQHICNEPKIEKPSDIQKNNLEKIDVAFARTLFSELSECQEVKDIKEITEKNNGKTRIFEAKVNGVDKILKISKTLESIKSTADINKVLKKEEINELPIIMPTKYGCIDEYFGGLRHNIRPSLIEGQDRIFVTGVKDTELVTQIMDKAKGEEVEMKQADEKFWKACGSSLAKLHNKRIAHMNLSNEACGYYDGRHIMYDSETNQVTFINLRYESIYENEKDKLHKMQFKDLTNLIDRYAYEKAGDEKYKENLQAFVAEYKETLKVSNGEESLQEFQKYFTKCIVEKNCNNVIIKDKIINQHKNEEEGYKKLAKAFSDTVMALKGLTTVIPDESHSSQVAQEYNILFKLTLMVYSNKSLDELKKYIDSLQSEDCYKWIKYWPEQ